MTFPLDPYLQILRRELATSLMPEEENGRRIAKFSHEMLTSLWVRVKQLPDIESSTVKKFSKLIPRLRAVFTGMDAGMIMTAELMDSLIAHPDYMAVETILQNVVSQLSRVDSDEARNLLVEIAVINSDHQMAFYNAVKDADIKPAKTEEQPGILGSQQRAALQAYLREKFPVETDLIVGNSKMIIGGGSKHTYFVDLANTRELPDSVVLRLDKSEGVVDSSVMDEYELIETVHQAGLPVPKGYVLENDTTVLGAPFMIVSRINGHNIGDWYEVHEPSREFAVGMAQALAKLHNIPLTGAGQRLPGAGQSIRERMETAIACFETSWRSSGKPSIAMEQAYAWLHGHMDFAEGQRSIIHCDPGCHNMLGENGKLTALLDWETAMIGNPAQDLTYTEDTVKQMMPWEEYLAEYERAGGTIPAEEQLDFYRLWRGCFRIHYQYLARAYFYSGLSSSLVHAYATQRLFMEAEKDLQGSVKTLYGKYR